MFDYDETASLIQELIKRPSRNPPGDEKECALFIYGYLQLHGIEAKLVDSPYPGRPQVVAWVRGSSSSPTLILNGHIDVVPEGDPSAWSVPPYGGIIREGKVFGRGAGDMKGGLAAMMLTARVLKKAEPLQGTLMLQFVIGEEAGEPGTRHLLVDQGYGGDWGIVLEATELKVSPAQNGLIWYQIDIYGNQAHASRPQDGVNAIARAAQLATQIEAYGNTLVKKTHPLGNIASASVTMIDGGIKENIIPDHCRIRLDRRILPGETVAAVDAEMNEMINTASEAYPDTKYNLKKLQVFESAEIDPDNPLARTLHRHSRIIADIPDTYWGESGATDARNFVNDAKIPCVVWGPGDHEGAHIVDEYIKVDEVIKSISILSETARELLG